MAKAHSSLGRGAILHEIHLLLSETRHSPFEPIIWREDTTLWLSPGFSGRVADFQTPPIDRL